MWRRDSRNHAEEIDKAKTFNCLGIEEGDMKKRE